MTKCANPGCGHPELDHHSEVDHSYCLGNVGGCPPCPCHGFEDPGDGDGEGSYETREYWTN